MKISALVAEFNPFHSGHKLLVDSMHSKSDAVVAIMSPNFVQRGECALFDKNERAISAVKNGVDLVLELPTVYALSSAEGFARGAVETLCRCGVVDELWFGSELGEISPLQECAEILNDEPAVFKAVLAEKLSEGLSFPAARHTALRETMHGSVPDAMPNNILALEYLRVLKKLSSGIVPVTIKRVGSGYNDSNVKGEIPSASAIRRLLAEGEDASGYMMHVYAAHPVFMHQFDVMVASRLKAISHEELCRIPDCNSEIASRLKDAGVYNTFADIVSHASCRRYTDSRLRRILCNMIIGNNFKQLPSPEYIRPLAFNSAGGEILRKMKNTASLPVAARGAILKNNDIFNLECRATDIYNLARKEKGGQEFSTAVQCL